MKVFQRYTHPKYKTPCLKGVCDPDGGEYLSEYSDDVFVADGYQWYVMVKDEDYGSWEHPEHGRIGLWNTHPTGELRWEERCSSVSIGPDALQAAKYFGIKKYGATDEEWEAILDKHKIKIESLSEIEVKLLKDANNQSGEAKIISREKVKILKDDGAEWHDTIRKSDKSHALYSLQDKGLINIGCKSSGPSFSAPHIYREVTYYKISRRGREIIKNGKV